MARRAHGNNAVGKVMLGFVLGALTAALSAFVYWKFGKARMARTVEPVRFARRASKPPANPGVGREEKKPPFGTSEDGFEAGARVYRARCASCHGTPTHDAPMANGALPLWRRHRQDGQVGVSAQTPGSIYANVAYGVPGKGMPAYQHQLSETQLWQVSLLLGQANKELPEPVQRILSSAP